MPIVGIHGFEFPANLPVPAPLPTLTPLLSLSPTTSRDHFEVRVGQGRPHVVHSCIVEGGFDTRLGHQQFLLAACAFVDGDASDRGLLRCSLPRAKGIWDIQIIGQYLGALWVLPDAANEFGRLGWAAGVVHVNGRIFKKLGIRIVLRLDV